MSEPFEPGEALVQKIIPGHTERLQLVGELHGASFRGPFEFKLGKSPGKLTKICFVSSLIGTTLGLQLELAARHGARDDLSQLADLAIQMIRAGVKRLVVD